MQKILVTGAAGFIGAAISHALLAREQEVIGLDNLNNYYDVTLKKARLKHLSASPKFEFFNMDIADEKALKDLFSGEDIKQVVHMAAQAGVRYSLENPNAYIKSNLVGFGHILECCRHYNIQHLVYASSSSVYGANERQPFSEDHAVDHPVSLYAATKKSNELMAHTYAHLYGLPCSGLRFFTVYGPWGRPDMALFKFTQQIIADEPIPVYNNGNMQRDFTYIDDVVLGIIKVLDRPATPDNHWSATSPTPATSYAPYAIYNIGNHQPIKLIDFISVLEKALGKEAKKQLLPMQAGDVPATYADTTRLHNAVGYAPTTPIDKGISAFVNWYRSFYGH